MGMVRAKGRVDNGTYYCYSIPAFKPVVDVEACGVMLWNGCGSVYFMFLLDLGIKSPWLGLGKRLWLELKSVANNLMM